MYKTVSSTERLQKMNTYNLYNIIVFKACPVLEKDLIKDGFATVFY